MANPLLRFLGINRRAQLSSPWADRSTLETATWGHLLGLDADQLPPTRREAMSVAALARGRNLIAASVGRLPLIAMRGRAPMPETPQLIRQPEAGRPRFLTLTWIVDALIWYGVAWLLITDRTADGRPARLAWVPQWQASVDENGDLTAAWDKPITPDQVIRIDGFHEGVLTASGDRIRAALRLDRASLRAADNPVPQVELHQVSGTPLSAEEAREFVASYVASRARSGVSYTNQSIETKTHGTNSENLLIDGRKAAALDAARILGLPAWAVDAPTDGTSMNYTNVPSRARELIDYTLAPYMEAITSRLSMDDVLPRGQWCRFDTDPLLAADFGDRMASYKTALETGVYTLDDLKARENGTPLEESETDQ